MKKRVCFLLLFFLLLTSVSFAVEKPVLTDAQKVSILRIQLEINKLVPALNSLVSQLQEQTKKLQIPGYTLDLNTLEYVKMEKKDAHK